MKPLNQLPEKDHFQEMPQHKESADCSVDISADVLQAVENLSIFSENLEQGYTDIDVQNLNDLEVKEVSVEGFLAENKKAINELERKVRIEKVVGQLNSLSLNKWKRILHKNMLGAKRILPLIPMCGVFWGGMQLPAAIESTTYMMSYNPVIAILGVPVVLGLMGLFTALSALAMRPALGFLPIGKHFGLDFDMSKKEAHIHLGKNLQNLDFKKDWMNLFTEAEEIMYFLKEHREEFSGIDAIRLESWMFINPKTGKDRGYLRRIQKHLGIDEEVYVKKLDIFEKGQMWIVNKKEGGEVIPKGVSKKSGVLIPLAALEDR